MDKKEARELLRKYLKRGDIVYTQVLHVSRSGMFRRIGVYTVHKNRIINISGLVSEVAQFKLDRKDFAVCVNGCGMDMGFHVVYELGRALFKPGKDAYSGKTNSDPGYALIQEWL